MRGIGAATLAMVVLVTGLALLTDKPVTFPLPPAGEAAAHRMPDGLPVFVAHEESGEVHVVDARNPREPEGALVSWCRSSGLFEDLHYGSRFTPAGDWIGGPAPHGLTRFHARRIGDEVVVGHVAGAPRRPAPEGVGRSGPDRPPGRGPSCL